MVPNVARVAVIDDPDRFSTQNTSPPAPGTRVSPAAAARSPGSAPSLSIVAIATSAMAVPCSWCSSGRSVRGVGDLADRLRAAAGDRGHVTPGPDPDLRGADDLPVGEP